MMTGKIREMRTMTRHMRGGLYYFFCVAAAGDELKPCMFKWWRRDCLSCLVRAARQLAAWKGGSNRW